MVVDEDSTTALDIENSLLNLGYEVAAVVNTGEKAVEIAKKDSPDMVLMEIRLAGRMDGIDAACIIHREMDMPIVFMSAHADESRLNRAKLARPFGYILKPIMEKELKISMEMALHFAAKDAGRKKTEARLKASEVQKQAILNGISSNIIFVNKKLEMIWANKAATESAGKTIGNMIEHRCHEFWGNPKTPCENCPVIKALRTEKTEKTIMYSEEGTTWEECGDPVFDAEGNIVGIVEITRDITGSKQPGNKPRPSEHNLKEVQTISFPYDRKPGFETGKAFDSRKLNRLMCWSI